MRTVQMYIVMISAGAWKGLSCDNLISATATKGYYSLTCSQHQNYKHDYVLILMWMCILGVIMEFVNKCHFTSGERAYESFAIRFWLRNQCNIIEMKNVLFLETTSISYSFNYWRFQLINTIFVETSQQ